MKPKYKATESERSRPRRKASVSRELKPMGLDEAAAAYAKLLADPCNAPLCPSIMTGANGALVSRFESDQIFNSSATDVGSCGFYCPSMLTSAAAANAIGVGGPWSSDTIPGTLTNATLATQPGFTFLAANASGARVVAACIQVSFIGTELQRAGIAAVGCAKYSTLIDGSPTLASMRTLAQIVTRTPDGVLEYRLPPSEASSLFRDPTTTVNLASEPTSQDFPALFWSFSGIPVSTGVRVRFVVVYEWIPHIGNGMVAPQMAAVARSRNTNADVLQSLAKTGDWLANGISSFSPFGGYAIKALAKGAGAYGNYLNKNRPSMG